MANCIFHLLADKYLAEWHVGSLLSREASAEKPGRHLSRGDSEELELPAALVGHCQLLLGKQDSYPDPALQSPSGTFPLGFRSWWALLWISDWICFIAAFIFVLHCFVHVVASSPQIDSAVCFSTSHEAFEEVFATYTTLLTDVVLPLNLKVNLSLLTIFQSRYWQVKTGNCPILDFRS